MQRQDSEFLQFHLACSKVEYFLNPESMASLKKKQFKKIIPTSLLNADNLKTKIYQELPE